MTASPPTEGKGRLPKSRGEALCILELWAERKDVQNMGWGWPEWRGMNPSFADELLACVRLLREQPAEPRDDVRRLEYVTHRLVRAEAALLAFGAKSMDTDYFKQFDPYVPGEPLPLTKDGSHA